MNAGRTALVFLFLVVLLRLMGRRQVSQMEPAEFAVALLIAELAVIPVAEPEAPLWKGLVPMALVFAGERILSLLSLRSIRLRRLLCGKPVILVENGRPILRSLRRTRINSDELSALLRRAGVLELSRVQYAIAETDGTVTVFPFPEFVPATAQDARIPVAQQELPCTVISEGRILPENLAAAGKDSRWLSEFLRSHRCTAGEVAILTVTRSGKTQLFRFRDC